MQARMPVESARSLSGETSPARTALRSCVVCGGEIPPTLRADAEHCKAACRARGSRQRHAIDPGPTLSEVIATRRRYLEATAKGVSTLKNFDVVARGLVPLAHRHVASITKEEWSAWVTSATQGFRESTKAMWVRSVRTLLKATPSWFSAAFPKTPNPPSSPPPALSRRRLAALCTAPRTQRTRLVMELLTAGFIPSEITRLRIGPGGEVGLDRLAWGRKKLVPRIPDTLQARLRAFSGSRGLAPGAQVFPVTTQAIRGVVKAAQHRSDIVLSPMALARSAQRRGHTRKSPRVLTA